MNENISSNTIAEPVAFRDMTIAGQVLFMGKLVIFICSLGFAFPTLLSN